MTVRVRFAPSPTGFLHVGGGRTALYNWLFAKHNGGTFILRSDDTDAERSTEEYAGDILASLQWLGISWDEGIEVGGPHGEYNQSRRLERYRDVAQQLVAAGAAYYSFATPEELDEFRRSAREEGRSPAYDARHEPDPKVAAQRVAEGEKAPIRFRVRRPGETVFTDIVRDEVRFDHAQVDDFVILRSDGTPTYHLASTVDDVDFAITHVIRGEDILSSTPKHILLTQAMGAAPAQYAHLSLLMGPDGKKLSKRHGHTSIRAYHDAGYVPEALTNYLALLGWSPGEDETVISRDQMVERFDLGAVSQNPAIFDTDKLEWMNGVYIRAMDPREFLALTLPMISFRAGRELNAQDIAALKEITPHVQERTKLLTEVPDQVRFLLVDSLDYDEASWKKVMKPPTAAAALEAAIAALTKLEGWDVDSIEAALRAMLAELELSASKGLQPLRVAVSGSSVSPPLFESMAVLGRDRTLERLTTAHGRL
jgi:glutamyl-tRNA synthetase